MFENIENIKLIDIVPGTSSLYQITKSRSNHGFVFKLSGSSRYEFSSGTIDLKEGEMIYEKIGNIFTYSDIYNRYGRLQKG